jgi:hypothetical protein
MKREAEELMWNSGRLEKADEELNREDARTRRRSKEEDGLCGVAVKFRRAGVRWVGEARRRDDAKVSM